MTKEYTGPKVLYFDIETYGGLKAHMSEVSMIGYKWAHEKETHVISGFDFPKEFKKDFADDKPVLKAFSALVEQADVIIAHYGQKFDRCFINSRIEKHGLPPLKPVRLIDTWRISKDNFALQGNSLNVLLKFFNAPDQKVDLTYEEWRKVQRGDLKSLKKLRDHCRNDVAGMAWIFENHLSHYTNYLPNHNLYKKGEENVCPHCGSKEIMKKGFVYTRTAVNQQYQCKSCRRWSSAPMTGKGRIR